MTKWTRTRRDPSRTYDDEQKKLRQERMIAKIQWFAEQAGHDDEVAFVEALKEAKPKITKEQLQAAVRQFHDAISSGNGAIQDIIKSFLGFPQLCVIHLVSAVLDDSMTGVDESFHRGLLFERCGRHS
jgi:hypothetical protein